jgi:hypothetical protein
MTTALIIFGISFVAVLTLAANKSKEIKTGRPMLSIGGAGSDEWLREVWNVLAYTITHASVRSVRQLTYRSIISFERLVISQFDRFSHRFALVGEIVTGRDIPKNRGSVSLFLKKIEHPKKTRSAVR